VILKDMPYFHLKLEPLVNLANCFMPMCCQGVRSARASKRQRAE
jgi:hypothetical protein